MKFCIRHNHKWAGECSRSLWSGVASCSCHNALWISSSPWQSHDLRCIETHWELARLLQTCKSDGILEVIVVHLTLYVQCLKVQLLHILTSIWVLLIQTLVIICLSDLF